MSSSHDSRHSAEGSKYDLFKFMSKNFYAEKKARKVLSVIKFVNKTIVDENIATFY